jgi:hypothetical protein
MSDLNFKKRSRSNSKSKNSKNKNNKNNKQRGGCYDNFNPAKDYVCPRTPLDKGIPNLQAIANAMKGGRLMQRSRDKRDKRDKCDKRNNQRGGSSNNDELYIQLGKDYANADKYSSNAPPTASEVAWFNRYGGNNTQVGGNCYEKGTQLGVNQACGANAAPTASEVAFFNRYGNNVQNGGVAKNKKSSIRSRSKSKKSTKSKSTKSTKVKATKATKSTKSTKVKATKAEKTGTTYKKNALNLVRDIYGKIAAAPSVLKNDKTRESFFDSHYTRSFKSGTHNKDEYSQKIASIYKSFDAPKFSYRIINYNDKKAKVYYEIHGKLNKTLRGKRPSKTSATLAGIDEVSLNLDKQKIAKASTKHTWLDAKKAQALKKIFQKGGQGYYPAVEQPPIGKMPVIDSYLSCCPPVFDGELLQNGGTHQLSNFCADMSTRDFNCRQPNWYPQCI